MEAPAATDQFSNLPEHIIHSIFSFLPTPKEVVRTSAVSKSWLHAWRSYPISDFDLRDFIRNADLGFLPKNAERMEEKSEQFIRFVDAAMIRQPRLPKFNLSTVRAMSTHVDRWIIMALDRQVEDLSITVWFQENHSVHSVPNRVCDRIFSSQSVRSLRLIGEGRLAFPLDEISCVNMASLRILYLYAVSNLSSQVLQKLLQGCPLLENLAIVSCDDLSEIEISGLNNLKVLKVKNECSYKLKLVRVTAPSLEKFSYKVESFEHHVTVIVNASPNLKFLKISHTENTDQWFHELISKFPLLETLIIDGCTSFSRIRISNPLIKKIRIECCKNLMDIRIDGDKLQSFFFLAYNQALPSIWMENPPYDCIADLRYSSCKYIYPTWFIRLSDFLTQSCKYRCLWFNVLDFDQDGEEIEEVVDQFPALACGIEELILWVNAPESRFSFFWKGLLSTCHPTFLRAISGNYPRECPFTKFTCEMLADPGDDKCCCLDDTMCWKHNLKDVKIEDTPKGKIQGDIRFRLQW